MQYYSHSPFEDCNCGIYHRGIRHNTFANAKVSDIQAHGASTQRCKCTCAPSCRCRSYTSTASVLDARKTATRFPSNCRSSCRSSLLGSLETGSATSVVLLLLAGPPADVLGMSLSSCRSKAAVCSAVTARQRKIGQQQVATALLSPRCSTMPPCSQA